VSTHRTEWHAEPEELAAYLAGEASPPLAASVEAHLVGCERCRAAIAVVGGSSAEAERDASWSRLADLIDRPSPTLLSRLTRGHWYARSVVATPTMLQATLVAVLLVGVVPLVVAATAGDAGLVALLVVAPLAPVAAVALAYRDRTDPVGETSLATPAAGLRLVALRSLLVSAVAMPAALVVLGAVDLWIQDVPVHLALAWCLPGLALAAVVLLAGTTRIDPLHVAVAAGAGWALLVGTAVTVRRALRPEVFVDLIAHPSVQGAALTIALGAVLLTVARRDALAYRRLG